MEWHVCVVERSTPFVRRRAQYKSRQLKVIASIYMRLANHSRKNAPLAILSLNPSWELLTALFHNCTSSLLPRKKRCDLSLLHKQTAHL